MRRAALVGLADSDGISGAAPARARPVTPQAMTTVLRNLEERGPVTATAHPWRRKVLEVRLTDAGAELLARADERAVGVERRIAAEFTPQERATLRSLPGRCAAAVEGR
jgi:DNA-binding MarR family transcriptional regulator